MSEVQTDNFSFRFDSEYFQKRFLENIERIKNYSLGFIKLNEVADEITGGATPLGAEYPESGVKFLRVQNVMQNYIDDSDFVYISQEDDKALKRSRLKLDDVLLTITGVSYGKSATVSQEFVDSNINQHSVRIQIKENSFNPLFLSTFLNSNVGKLQSDKNITGVTRPALDYQAIRLFVIPNTTDAFQDKISKTVKEAHAKLEESKALYAEAENLLLDELGLRDWSPSDDSISVKSFTESFADTGRLDAEYYQPHYFEIIEKCKSYHLGWASLKDIVESMTNGVESREFVEEGVPYIRVADIGFLRIDLDKAQKIPFKEASDLINKIQLKKDDVLTVRSGSIGQAAVIKQEDVSAVLSSHLIRLRIKENAGIKGVFLALFLETLAGKQQIMMQSNGAIVPEVSQPALSRIVVPFLDINKQENLERLIHLSETGRKESKQLLEIAKRAVEIAIEESEAAALEWIEAQTAAEI